MRKESASLSSPVLTSLFDHTVLNITLPDTKLSHIKEPPTSESTSGGKPQETKLFGDHLSSKLFTFPSFSPLH